MVLAFQMLKNAALLQSYIFEGHKMNYMKEMWLSFLLPIKSLLAHLGDSILNKITEFAVNGEKRRTDFYLSGRGGYCSATLMFSVI